MSEARILVVDDDAVTRLILKHLLSGAGYHVEQAADGCQALQLLSRQKFQIVISDWNMPGMSGVDLCRNIRTHDAIGYIYTILLTSNNAENDRIEGMRAGADDFVGKPFNQQELLQRVAAGTRVLRLQTKEALIFALAKLAESRDIDTGYHLERVQRYSKLLATQLMIDGRLETSVDDDFVENVFQTSPLHDIGKVGIPDSVLLHPGKLTSAQFEVMKSHTTIGADCLLGALERSPSAEFLRMACDIALSHHEKFDGSGYPHGLAGDAIPLSARVVAVADVYDALRSKRVYKNAFSHTKAVAIIDADSGTHFDPRLVDSFKQIHRQFDAIADRFDPQKTDAGETAVADVSDAGHGFAPIPATPAPPMLSETQ